MSPPKVTPPPPPPPPPLVRVSSLSRRHQCRPRVQRRHAGAHGLRCQRKRGSISRHHRAAVQPLASLQPHSRSPPQSYAQNPPPLTKTISRQRVPAGAVCHNVLTGTSRSVSHVYRTSPPTRRHNNHSNNCVLSPSTASLSPRMSQRSTPRILPLPAATVVGGVAEAADVQRLFVSDSALNIM
jgi:hypothetical protein